MSPPVVVTERAWFKPLFDSSPDPTWIIKGNRFVECNQAALLAMGYATREEFLGVHPSRLSPPRQPSGEDSFVAAERMMAIAREEGINRFDWTHVKADGSEFLAEVTLAALRIDGQEIIYCTWRDVTAHKRVQDQLLGTARLLKTLSTMSSDWFWKQDEHFRFVEFPDSFASNFAPPINPIGKTRWELGIELTPQQWAAHRADLEAHRPFRNFEYHRPDTTGESNWYSINGEPTFDESGRFTGYIGTGKRITARKLAEQQLRIAAIAFESQEGMIVTDAQTTVLKVNRAFTRTTGYEADEIVGRKPDLLRSGRHDKDFYRARRETVERTGVWQGEHWERRKNGEIYPAWVTITAVRDTQGKTTHYVGTHVDNSERQRAQEEIQLLAYSDPLTRLPNRRLLLDRVNQTLASSARNRRHAALMLIDLDDFKTLNDTLGHDKGDALLQQVGRRLVECLREGDTVARVGGDEFAVMLKDLGEDPSEAASQSESVADKIRLSLNETYRLGGYEHRSTASIGVTLFCGRQASVEDLLKQADLAMYQAKASGRNSIRFFDPEMQAIVTARAEMEIELREALRQGQFVLHYQPQILGCGRVVGAEVLVRWQHPRRGMVPPAEFIPLCEATGLILPLGLWVLETACAQLAAWARQPQTADLYLAVNVSANQLHQDDFVAQVIGALTRTGARPDRLKLELTESLLVQNVESAISKMIALKAHGVGFSLDDFGTGYSSLAYLKRLPLDQLKIDISFVREIQNNLSDAAIAKMIIALADSMGLKVIAEGVETEDQRKVLASQGCHGYQGYLYSRPLPLAEFGRYLAGRREARAAPRDLVAT